VNVNSDEDNDELKDDPKDDPSYIATTSSESNSSDTGKEKFFKKVRELD